ncbi:hypothetical protein CONPUDRAFT_70680 [Coniophora puteana RWD-64-598 SS2]|uniref:Uncharacterized protein n=1 Tax=Coniophora puteana (strain RWD-64-598) TaxID=741705 RepID=A0A5M3MYQ0_CONPW|nr:uncharacterized protein CONPUDRAFT_70680 [Coniophora puteana RWD-64-598 SS2]EIW83721.1 hypothetical protein CONPUDRAFT_70680 [Coniophora puteana RWD-64-598 SS2]
MSSQETFQQFYISCIANYVNLYPKVELIWQLRIAEEAGDFNRRQGALRAACLWWPNNRISDLAIVKMTLKIVCFCVFRPSSIERLIISRLTYVYLGQLALPKATILGLKIMMTSRAYAMYGGSKKVLIFLVVAFLSYQGFNIPATIFLLIKINVVVITAIPYHCGYEVSESAAFLELASNLLACAYEVALLVMVLCHTVLGFRASYGNKMWKFDTFMSIMARDHVFYFAISIIAVFAVFSSWNSPIMLLSIRRFNADKNRGETADEAEMETVEFATVGQQSGSSGTP